jgi:hypothetical protein
MVNGESPVERHCAFHLRVEAKSSLLRSGAGGAACMMEIPVF